MYIEDLKTQKNTGCDAKVYDVKMLISKLHNSFPQKLKTIQMARRLIKTHSLQESRSLVLGRSALFLLPTVGRRLTCGYARRVKGRDTVSLEPCRIQTDLYSRIMAPPARLARCHESIIRTQINTVLFAMETTMLLVEKIVQTYW